MGPGSGEARVFLLVNAISYGGDAFRGRETLRDAPHAVLHEDEVSLDLGELPLGLHQVRVHLHAAPGTPSVAESAAFFEIRMRPPQEEEDGTEQVCRGAGAWGHTQCAAEAEGAPGEEAARRARLLSDAFDEKAWLNEEGWGGERQEEARTALFAEYAALHARMGRADTPVGERRVLLLDQRAGGLGNRLGSVISGLLLAILSRRALAVAWDLGGYLDDGDPARGGIEWQHPSLEAARARYALPPGAAGDTSHWTDMGEMAELLVCGNLSEALGAAAVVQITNPHYYLPLIASNPHHRRSLVRALGARPAGALFNFLFRLAPRLQAKVDAVRSRFRGRTVGLQVRMARDCGKISLPADLGGRTRTHAYLTAEHERLFFDCGLSLLRAAHGNGTFFVASDLPALSRAEAARRLGADRTVFADLPDLDVHGTRAAMEEGRPTDFDGAFLDLWLLGECDEVVTTPASSFGYMATARTGRTPVTVTKWGKCLRPLSPEPFSHAWLLVKGTSCLDARMLLPEHDMFCQDCVVLECPCGDLTCASHSERMPPLFPRQVATVPG